MPQMQSDSGSPLAVAESERGLLHPHPLLLFSFFSHPDIPGFRLAAPAEPKGCVRHRLHISSHRSCFLSTRSLIGCRKLLVLFLGDRERQARSASLTQTRMPQAPGSQSRAGTRFPPVQHQELGADIRNNGEKLKSCAACSLSPGLVQEQCHCSSLGVGMEFPGRSVLLPQESSGFRGWAESLWRQTSSSSVIHGFFPFGTLSAVSPALCGSRFCQAGLSPSPSVWVKAGGWSPVHSTRGQHWVIPGWCEGTQGWFSTTRVLHQSQ